MRMVEAVEIARLLGVPLTDVMENAGVKLDASGARTVPVVGYIDGEGEAHIDWDAKRERIGMTADLPDDTVALIVKPGDGTAMSAFDGWTYFIAPPAPPSADIFGRLCAVGLENHQTLLRFVKRGYKAGTYNLSGQVTVGIENARLDWASPVLLIRPA